MWLLTLVWACASVPDTGSEETESRASDATESDTPTDSDAPTDSDTRSDTGEEVFDTGDAAPIELLDNGGFEDGETGWARYGSGSYDAGSGDAAEGSTYVRLGGPHFALLYQRVPGSPGERYLARVQARSEDGTQEGTLKLEFQDASGTKVDEHTWSFSAPSAWHAFQVGAVMPAGATQVTVALVSSDTQVDFDDASLVVAPTRPLVFDLADTRHGFEGLGAQIWGYATDTTRLAEVLDDLDIRHVRIENVDDTATDAQLAETWAVTSARDIGWLFHCWSAPAAYTWGGGLSDVDGFASWWVETVQALDALGHRPEAIELMNEPDSEGAWSTGITATDWATLTGLVREGLDDAGLDEVGIVGPGGSGLDYFHSNRNYVLALESADPIAAFSSHAWDDDAFCDGGAQCLAPRMRNLTDPVRLLDADAAFWITEWGSKETTFGGQSWPSPDTSGTFNATDSVGYGVRLLDDATALLNGGASRLYLWQLLDEPNEVENKDKGWGLVDLDGDRKPAYLAVQALQLPVPGTVLAPPALEGVDLGITALTDEHTTVFVLANDDDTDQDVTLWLRGLSARPTVSGTVYGGTEGDVATETRGEATLTDPLPDTRYGGGTLELLLTVEANTAAVLRVEHG